MTSIYAHLLRLFIKNIFNKNIFKILLDLFMSYLLYYKNKLNIIKNIFFKHCPL